MGAGNKLRDQCSRDLAAVYQIRRGAENQTDPAQRRAFKGDRVISGYFALPHGTGHQ